MKVSAGAMDYSAVIQKVRAASCQMQSFSAVIIRKPRNCFPCSARKKSKCRLSVLMASRVTVSVKIRQGYRKRLYWPERMCPSYRLCQSARRLQGQIWQGAGHFLRSGLCGDAGGAERDPRLPVVRTTRHCRKRSRAARLMRTSAQSSLMPKR